MISGITKRKYITTTLVSPFFAGEMQDSAFLIFLVGRCSQQTETETFCLFVCLLIFSVLVKT